MTTPPETPAAPVPEPPQEPSPTPPLAPKPGNLAVAFLLVLLLFANLYLDARPGDYDGKYLTFAVVGLIAAVLGVDVSRVFRGKSDQ